MYVLPATTATAERSFSSLRRLKTYLRTTMSSQRLNHLMILHVHKDSTESLICMKFLHCLFQEMRDVRMFLEIVLILCCTTEIICGLYVTAYAEIGLLSKIIFFDFSPASALIMSDPAV